MVSGSAVKRNGCGLKEAVDDAVSGNFNIRHFVTTDTCQLFCEAAEIHEEKVLAPARIKRTIQEAQVKYYELSSTTKGAIEALHYLRSMSTKEIARVLGIDMLLVEQHLKILDDRIKMGGVTEKQIVEQARTVDLSPYFPSTLDSFKPVVKVSKRGRPASSSVTISLDGYVYIGATVVSHYGLAGRVKVLVLQDGKRYAFRFADEKGQYLLSKYHNTHLIYNRDLAYKLYDAVGDHPLVKLAPDRTIVLERR